MKSAVWMVLVTCAMALGACGDDDASAMDAGDRDGGEDAGMDATTEEPVLDVSRPECENLNPGSCLLPWPSSRYLVEDATTATGYRISIPMDATPTSRRGPHVDPSIFDRFDGFSPLTTMMTVFDGRIDTSSLASELAIADSLLDSSPTVLLDAETGERVPHFAEIDEWPSVDPQHAPFYIRPAARLRENARYIVAIRRLVHEDGSPSSRRSTSARSVTVRRPRRKRSRRAALRSKTSSRASGARVSRARSSSRRGISTRRRARSPTAICSRCATTR